MKKFLSFLLISAPTTVMGTHNSQSDFGRPKSCQPSNYSGYSWSSSSYMSSMSSQTVRKKLNEDPTFSRRDLYLSYVDAQTQKHLQELTQYYKKFGHLKPIFHSNQTIPEEVSVLFEEEEESLGEKSSWIREEGHPITDKIKDNLSKEATKRSYQDLIHEILKPAVQDVLKNKTEYKSNQIEIAFEGFAQNPNKTLKKVSTSRFLKQGDILLIGRAADNLKDEKDIQVLPLAWCNEASNTSRLHSALCYLGSKDKGGDLIHYLMLFDLSSMTGTHVTAGNLENFKESCFLYDTAFPFKTAQSSIDSIKGPRPQIVPFSSYLSKIKEGAEGIYTTSMTALAKNKAPEIVRDTDFLSFNIQTKKDLDFSHNAAPCEPFFLTIPQETPEFNYTRGIQYHQVSNLEQLKKLPLKERFLVLSHFLEPKKTILDFMHNTKDSLKFLEALFENGSDQNSIHALIPQFIEKSVKQKIIPPILDWQDDHLKPFFKEYTNSWVSNWDRHLDTVRRFIWEALLEERLEPTSNVTEILKKIEPLVNESWFPHEWKTALEAKIEAVLLSSKDFIANQQNSGKSKEEIERVILSHLMKLLITKVSTNVEEQTIKAQEASNLLTKFFSVDGRLDDFLKRYQSRDGLFSKMAWFFTEKGWFPQEAVLIRRILYPCISKILEKNNIPYSPKDSVDFSYPAQRIRKLFSDLPKQEVLKNVLIYDQKLGFWYNTLFCESILTPAFESNLEKSWRDLTVDDILKTLKGRKLLPDGPDHRKEKIEKWIDQDLKLVLEYHLKIYQQKVESPIDYLKSITSQFSPFLNKSAQKNPTEFDQILQELSPDLQKRLENHFREKRLIRDWINVCRKEKGKNPTPKTLADYLVEKNFFWKELQEKYLLPVIEKAYQEEAKNPPKLKDFLESGQNSLEPLLTQSFFSIEDSYTPDEIDGLKQKLETKSKISLYKESAYGLLKLDFQRFAEYGQNYYYATLIKAVPPRSFEGVVASYATCSQSAQAYPHPLVGKSFEILPGNSLEIDQYVIKALAIKLENLENAEINPTYTYEGSKFKIKCVKVDGVYSGVIEQIEPAS